MPGYAPETFIGSASTRGCLVAVPRLVLAEATALTVGRTIAGRLVDQGFIADSDPPRPQGIVRAFVRMRDGVLPWCFVVAAIVAVIPMLVAAAVQVPIGLRRLLKTVL